MVEHARTENKRTKESTAHGQDSSVIQKIGGEWKFQKRPQFLKNRTDYFNNLYEQQKAKYADFPRKAIKITLPDGNVKEGTSFETTPVKVAEMISKQLAKKIIVAKVRILNRIATLDDGLMDPESEKAASDPNAFIFWDATRPFEGDVELQLLQFTDNEGRETFWHSSAHVLGETLELEYGVHLTHGPPTADGFFYDSFAGKDFFTDKNYKVIEDCAKKIQKEKQTFQRLVLSKDEALQLFSENPFKVQTIKGKIPDGSKVTAYKSGDLIDLCTGPHIPSTELIKAFKVMKNSAALWLGKQGNDSLQRVYAVSYPSQKELDEYIHLKEEADRRDHRIIGKDQKLYDMHELSPGCGFFYYHGTLVYNKLIEIIRTQFRVRGYQEVLSPNVFNLKLWKTSGHYANYKENMFAFSVENSGFGMKPMNCPGHCLMFDNTIRSYRELPLRYADFGVLHRNEISGALSGLTRVRRFQQDDAHIFCTQEQLMQEVMGCLDFLAYIYDIFGFTFELELSTRPEKKLGSEKLWDMAEGALEEALNKFGKPWKLNPGDGAFYGPKIDIKVYDALKRRHQCGTVQCDFQLPIRFNLQYQAEGAAKEQEEAGKNKENKDAQEDVKLAKQVFDADEFDKDEFVWQERALKPGFKRPVIVHRAILGSVERFMAILIEHLAGKWPFFISPRQVIVIPISEKANGYCESVYRYLHREGFQVTWDSTSGQVNKKIRNAQLAQWNYILVAGEDEMKDGLVDVRTRDNKRHGKMRVDDLVEHFKTLEPSVSDCHNRMYEKVWNPADYKRIEKAPEQELPKDEKLASYEKILAKSTFMAGNAPSSKDNEALADLKDKEIEPAVCPHLFAWYAQVSRYSEAARKAWPAPVENAKGGKKQQQNQGKGKKQQQNQGNKKQQNNKGGNKKQEKKQEKKEEEDDMDLFGEQTEEDKAAAEKAKKKADAGKKKKAPPVAKSLILYEVKPWGEETDLDELAKKILAIEMDGLLWKTQYKKEPIAYGVFKLLIGATVEDDKVSTDDLQEKIEAFEDFVQSVDIAAFNKV